MGSESGKSDEHPAHSVTVRGFWMDKTEVTNEQFDLRTSDKDDSRTRTP